MANKKGFIDFLKRGVNAQLNDKEEKYFIALIIGTFVGIPLTIEYWFIVIPILIIVVIFLNRKPIIKKWRSFNAKIKKIIITASIVTLIIGSGITYFLIETHRLNHIYPSLNLENELEITTKDKKITIKGTASPKHVIISINDDVVETNNGAFELTLPLENEKNEFEVTADNKGNSHNTKDITVYREFYGDDLEELNKRKAEFKAYKEKQRQEKIQNHVDDIQAEISAVDNFNSSLYRGDRDSILDALPVFRSWIRTAHEAQESDIPEIVSAGNRLEKKVSQLQAREFPLMRKSYADFARNEMWVDNIDVKIKGSGYNTIEFIHYGFVDNKNIQDSHAIIRSTLEDLRFNRANYKWSDSSYAEYTYYDIDSEADSST